MPLFPPAKAVLAAGAGGLDQTPFPLLLHAIFAEERTVCLELKQNTLEKRLFFEDGVPVDCTTNLLHETLGRFLVREGKVTDKQYQAALARSTSTGVRMGELLVQKGLLTPYDLFRMMQKSLALKILDCFRWTGGRWRLLLDVESVGTPLKINPAQLVLTGCSTSLPYPVVTAALGDIAGDRYAAVPRPVHDLGSLKLSGKETKLLKQFADRPDLATLMTISAFGDEELLRRLYAFILLGIVATAQEVDAMPPDAPPAQEPPPAAASGRSPDEVRNDVLGLLLEYRDLDPFDILGVEPSARLAEIRAAFLVFSERFAPWALDRGELGDVVDKAEALFLAGARAFGELADAERREQVVRRREVRSQQGKELRKGPDFRIRTDLLDGDTQFANARELFDAGNLSGAVANFEYAVDIDPKPAHRAWLWWARFKHSPGAAAEAAAALEQVVIEAPRDPDAARFLVEIRRALASPG